MMPNNRAEQQRRKFAEVFSEQQAAHLLEYLEQSKISSNSYNCILSYSKLLEYNMREAGIKALQFNDYSIQLVKGSLKITHNQ